MQVPPDVHSGWNFRDTKRSGRIVVDALLCQHAKQRFNTYPTQERHVDSDTSGMIPTGNGRRSRRMITAFFCVAAVLFAACLVQAADDDDRTLITQRCLGCHGMEKNCEVSVNDPEWWKETVLRMVEYKSELLNDVETDKVAFFLADERKRSTLCSSN
ncbi:MAG: hypothetical protein EOM37_17325 [Proteobacteria bacterium]|nr:hypothetical protein [Pseudomonadota bacterium]